MGIWITVIIVLFILGSIFGLRPSARERFSDNLRTLARRLELHPKIVPCPDWLTLDGDPTHNGKGMVAQYGLVIEHTTLPACDYQIINGEFRPYTGKHSANFALDKKPVDFPPSIAPNVLGLSAKANFIYIYWRENVGMGNPTTLENSENDLILLKNKLAEYAELIKNFK